MALTRNDVAQLYTPIYDEFMLETYAEETQKHQHIFQSIDDSTKTYDFHGLSGLGEWVDADEMASGGFEDPVLVYRKTFTQTKKWKKFETSFESVDQDEYALLEKEDDARQMGRGSRARVERDTATILHGGFATAGPDAEFLYSNAHPKNRSETGTVFDNLLSGPFSHDNLELAEKQISDNYFDSKGIPIEFSDRPCLMYPDALKGPVKRVLEERAIERPGTENRDINIYAGDYIPINWRWLGAKLGGSDTAWYIIYKELNFLKIIWSARPHFTAWIDEDAEAYKFKGRMLYDVGACSWRHGFASTGI